MRIFSLCDNMKWSHLPVAGGLYDQDPELLDHFRFIFAKRAEHEEKEQKERERKQQAASRPSRTKRR